MPFWCDNVECLESLESFESEESLLQHQKCHHSDAQMDSEVGHSGGDTIETQPPEEKVGASTATAKHELSAMVAEIVPEISTLATKLRISQVLFGEVLRCFKKVVELQNVGTLSEDIWSRTNAVSLFNLCERAVFAIENDIVPSSLDNANALLASFQTLVQKKFLLTIRQISITKTYIQDLQRFRNWLAACTTSCTIQHRNRHSSDLKTVVDQMLKTTATPAGEQERNERIRAALQAILTKRWNSGRVSIFGSSGTSDLVSGTSSQPTQTSYITGANMTIGSSSDLDICFQEPRIMRDYQIQA